MSSRDLQGTPLVRALAAFSGVLLAAYLGCNNDANTETNASATAGPAVTGAGAGSGACQYNVPDGECNAPETCECLDCPMAAKCTERCNDNGMCEFGGNVAGNGPTGEDCSCVDCYNKVPECSTEANDCSNDPDENDVPQNLCTATERCTCPDCTDQPACTGSCENNGICNPAFEGCSCSDCANHVDCGGTGPTSSSTTASSTVASTVASTGAGGTGGAGGN